jgi:TolA-binding protein
MTCDRVKGEDLAEQYIAGRLPASEAGAFEEHFFECDACTQEVLLLQAAKADLMVCPLLPRAERHRHRWLRVLALGALAVLVVAIGLVQRDRNTNRGTVSQAPTQPISPEQRAVTGSAERTSAGETQAAPAQHKPAVVATQTSAEKIESRNDPRSTVVADASPPVASSPPRKTVKGEGIQDPEGAKRLFVLGEIEPPVYSFAGFNSATGKRKKMTGANAGQDSLTSGKGAVTEDPTAKKKPGDGENLLFQEKFRQAMTAYIDGDYSKSAELLGQVVTLDSAPPEAYFYLGISRMMIGRPRDAVEPMQVAARIGNGTLQSSAHLFLGKAYVQLRQLDQAESEFEKTLTAGGRNAILAKRFLTETRLLKAQVASPSKQ